MKFHIVKNGESLKDILFMYSITEDEFRELNRHIKSWKDLIPGIKVKIPVIPESVDNDILDMEPFIEDYYPKNDSYEEEYEEESKIEENDIYENKIEEEKEVVNEQVEINDKEKEESYGSNKLNDNVNYNYNNDNYNYNYAYYYYFHPYYGYMLVPYVINNKRRR